ncbi:MAG: ATP-binding protein [Terriglobales bacterium]
MRALRYLWVSLAAIGISLAATGILILVRPDRAITLLIYLPGIVVMEALLGPWGGVAAVLLSVAGSATYRAWFFLQRRPTADLYITWEEELILLAVGLFVVVLMELRRRSGMREATGAKQMAVLLEHIADAVLIFDRGMRVIAMNPAAHIMLDRPGETLVGERLEVLRTRFTFTSGLSQPPMPLEQATAAGISTRAEGSILDEAKNRHLEVLVSATPLRNAANEIAGSLVLLTDITPLKELQQRTLDNARHLAIAQMVSGLSHDFNHVLDIVRRAVAVLEIQEDAPVVERRKYREMIDRAAVDGGQIVRRLRDYLAGGAGAMGEVDLVQVAHEAVELTRPLWRTRPALEVVEDLQPVAAVYGSANDLRRVLVNLIFNSIEALGAGAGRILVHTGPCAPSATASSRICVWVEDNGPGVAASIRAHLFQPYFTTKPHGMGMGLFGAQKIALAHGGQLRLALENTAGTRIVMELPAASTRSPAVSPAA